MFRYIAPLTTLAAIIAGIVLNFLAAGTKGLNIIEMASLNDFGMALLVWQTFPIQAGIILAVALVSIVATKVLFSKK